MAKSKVRVLTGTEALKQRIVQVFLSALGLAVLAGILLMFIRIQNGGAGLKRQLLVDWENGLYAEVFEKSSQALEEKPLDSFLLNVNGFASYQLAISQINSADTFFYLNGCIWSLRKALHKKNADKEGRIRYVLGKAYYEKGPDYADLAVRYLEEARAAGYAAKDISEYLGLAYEAVQEYRKSVGILTTALDAAKSDPARLFLAIARSYTGLEDWDKARDYLTRCIEQTRDGALAINARVMLGKVLRNSGDLSGAETVFNDVLESTEIAEAAYELGEVYAAQGDAIRARAAWRRAYRADNNYRPARLRLNM
jgi:tetratricopeptide (TPR) repeat protein